MDTYVSKQHDMYFKKLEERLGDRFDLSKVKFNVCNDKITLVCKKCGSERIVILSNALKHNVCCSNIRCKNEAKRLKFEEQGRAKWGDQFDYSKAHTLGDRNVKLEIKCNKCGDTIYQSKQNHLKHKPCCSCWVNPATLTNQEFIDKAKEIHGEKYDYSKVDYKHTNIPVNLKCNRCGTEFLQKPYSHLQGKGCSVCGKKLSIEKHTKGTEKFIKEAIAIHGEDKFDYSRVNYVNTEKKVEIVCIACNKSFMQTPHSHLKGSGCPICNGSISEKEIAWFLLYNNIDFIKEYSIPNSKYYRYRYDFYIPSMNLLVEYDGIQHYIALADWLEPELEKKRERDRRKTQMAIDYGYTLFRIPFSISVPPHVYLANYLKANFKYNVNGTVYKYSIDALKALNYTGDNPAKFLKQYKVKYKLPKLYAPLSSNRYSKAG